MPSYANQYKDEKQTIYFMPQATGRILGLAAIVY